MKAPTTPGEALDFADLINKQFYYWPSNKKVSKEEIMRVFDIGPEKRKERINSADTLEKLWKLFRDTSFAPFGSETEEQILLLMIDLSKTKEEILMVCEELDSDISERVKNATTRKIVELI